MKLISCHIENFGKLQDFDYVFESEKNILHRDNGWGKSTLATFIRVMFYGFLGENKRTVIDNERKKYRPWQTGVYGGSIVFRVNDREYRMERLFGEKKSGSDEFVLYDNVTNLRSYDYSANVGEELFGIDLESFMRTVFIAQQDCGTEVTSGISAKIGNVADQTADMGNYNQVQNQLKKEMDKLTPDRATGLISKLNLKIAELGERVRGKDSYENAVAELAGRMEDLRISRDEKLRQQEDIQEQIRQVSALKDVMSDSERKKLGRARRLFEHYEPSLEEIDDLIAGWNARNGKEELISIKKANAELYKRAHEIEEGSKSHKVAAVVLLVTGVMAVLGGIITIALLKEMIVGAAIVVIGGSIAVAGVLLIRGTKTRSDPMALDVYGRMISEIEEDEKLIAKVEETCRALFDRLHIRYNEDEVSVALNHIRDLAKDYEELSRRSLASDPAEKAIQSRDSEKEDGAFGYPGAGSDGEMLSLKELNSSFGILQDEINAIRETLESYRGLLDKNIQQLETIENDEQELKRLLEERENAMKKYRVIARTREYLEKAKQNFSGKYMEDIKTSFEKYRRIISDSDEKYELDTNLNIQLKDRGRLHEIGYLSEGYKDLVGLCRRMAMVDAMYDLEKPFLIFDDPFVNLDEKRTEGATEFLDALAREYQVIYFTCHRSRSCI